MGREGLSCSQDMNSTKDEQSERLEGECNTKEISEMEVLVKRQPLGEGRGFEVKELKKD